jgi:cytoskeletal protein RodZ
MQSLGQHLKQERETRQVALVELAQITRIPARMLRGLEQDDYANLPADVFVRGYLKAYCRALNIDEVPVLDWFTRGRPTEKDLPVALPLVDAPETGRRFGIAIALVILLILFTLALSIVLRPRHRDTPIELSMLSPTSIMIGESCERVASQPKPSFYGPSTTATPIASSRC